MNRIILVPVLMLLSLLLAACGESEEPPPNVEETVAVAVAATVAAQPQPQPVAEVPEPTPYPTYTPLPTYTPFPTPEVVEVEATEEPTVEPEAQVGSGAEPAPTEPPPAEPTVAPTPSFITAVRAADGTTMVFVPAGEFLMGASDADLSRVGAGGPPKLAGGDEQPQHPVNLDAFWIDQTEVTNAQYSNFVNLTGFKTIAELETFGFSDGEQVNGAAFYHPQGVDSGIDDKLDHPVVQVAWEDASAYCRWVGARLPTEAEWEKAAKGAAGDRIFPWGNAFQLPEFDISTVANACDASCAYEEGRDPNVDDGFARTAPVGSYPTGASPYGALDMAGNVWEWVDGSYEGYPDNSYELAEDFGDYFRIVRGGSWDNSAQILRATFRQNNPPRTRSDGTGFRCAVAAADFEPAPAESQPDEPAPEPTIEPTPAPAEGEPPAEPDSGG